LADTVGENDTKRKVPEFCNKKSGTYAKSTTEIFSFLSQYQTGDF